MKIKAGTIKRLHVSQPNLIANRKDGGARPVLSISTSNGVYHADRVRINGPSELVYDNINPLKCGAKAWIATKAELEFERREE